MAHRPRLLHAFATFQAAGPQVRTAALLNAFGGEFEHAVVALDGHTEARGLIAQHVPLRMLESPPRAGSLATVRALRSLLHAEAPDLVLTYNWGAMDALVAARTRRLSIVHHEDGFRPDEVHGFKLRRSLARRVLLGGARAVVVPSETLGKIARETWRLPGVIVVPNGIDVDRFAPQSEQRDERRRELGVDANALVVGTVGHLRKEKNPLRLLAAFATLGPNAHLCFVGDGPEREPLEKQARALGIQPRVHLLGHRADPSPWLWACDIFALSSDTEQMPVAMLEAMAAELPVAATAVGDVRVILPREADEYVVPATAEALGSALRALADDAALRQRLGRRNRERVRERFSFAAMRDAHHGIWRSALGAQNADA
ncbi:MAG: glycosyltransferase [Planctomycetota bacterium]